MDTGFNQIADFDNENLITKRYISLFLSNWYWFAIALFVSLTIAYGINRYSQRVYLASSTLLIKDDQATAVKNNVESVIPGGDIFKSQQNLVNEMGILKSFSLNYKVMKSLKDFHVVYVAVGRRGIVERLMYKSCPFIIDCDSLELQPRNRINIEILSESKYKIIIDDDLDFEKTINFGERFDSLGFDFVITPKRSGFQIFDKDLSNRYYFYFIDALTLANQYRDKLTVAPIDKDASIVNLSVSGYVPEQEIDYLNCLMKEYINNGLELKNATADSTIKFIDRQIRIISDSLKNAEMNMENFRKENNFFDISQEGMAIKTKLENLENEKKAFELQLQYYLYLEGYLQSKNMSGTIISPSVMGITDQVLLKLVDELSAIKMGKSNLNFNLAADQPVIELLDKQAEETTNALIENIRNGIEGLKLSIAESDKKISEVDKIINRLPTTEKSYINIQRTFDLNNTVYTYLLEKRAESGIARASNLPDNRIIDPATSSGPVKPKPRNNYAIAILLGLILPMVGLWLIDYFNDRVIDKKDVERKTNVPVIGFISHFSGKNELAVIEKPSSSLAESFRSVRTALKYYVKEDETPVIAVSSTISSEGKTFISVNLAAIIAMANKKVLLVGLDLRKPRLNRIFDFKDNLGMSLYLSGNCTYDEIVNKTSIDNLFFVASGPVPPNPSELIETDLMRDFFERAKKEFDIILLDTPPVAIVTDALLLWKYVDINIFIVRQRYSSRNTLELIEHLNKQGELKHMSIIINDISLSGYYGYGMRYGYYQGYGYYYGSNYYDRNYYGRYGDSGKINGYYTED